MRRAKFSLLFENAILLITKIHTRQVPLAKLAILLSIGIGMFRMCADFDFLSLSGVAMVLAVFSLLYYWLHYMNKTPVLMIMVILAGYLISGIQEQSQQSLRLSPGLLSSTPLVEMEVEEVRHYKKSIALIGSIVRVNGIPRRSPKMILYGKKTDAALTEISRGTIISSDSRISTIDVSENQSFVAYNAYLIDQGIYYTGFINPGQYKSSNSQQYAWWKVIRYDIREYTLARLDRYLTGETNAITRALLLGDKSKIDKETREKYAHSGIIHILAVSGLHVGFIAVFLVAVFDRLFFFLGPFSWFKVGFVSLALIGYMELSGGAPPVRRAIIMAILYLFARVLRKNFSPINILGFAAILLLCISPNQLFTVSFQLSFAAVGGIILFVPYLMSYCKYEHKHIRKFLGIVSMGIAAQISTLPITFYYFNQVPIFSALAGVIAIPVTGFAVCNGVLILLFGGFSDGVAELLAIIQTIFVLVLDGVAHFFSNLSFSIWDGVTLLPVESLLLLLAILALAFYLNTRRSVALVVAAFLVLMQAVSHTYIVVMNHKDTEVGILYDDHSDIDYRIIKQGDIDE